MKTGGYDTNGFLSRAMFVAAAALVLIGAVSRIAPLFDRDGRLLRQYPSEDGYLMLTIGRNLALGNGLSVSDGTVHTNGTQPLATFVWAGAFASAGGDKREGVFRVLALSVAVATIAAALVFFVAGALMPGDSWRAALAAVVAALWYASPQAVKHSMNCLETGIFLVFVLLVWVAYPGWVRASDGGRGYRSSVAMGALLGATFWARNDAVFLIAAVCLYRLFESRDCARDLRQTVCAGAISVVVASPWLIHNYVGFGHIVPISGLTESKFSSFGENGFLVPGKIAEYLIPFADMSTDFERSALGIAVAVVIVGIAACAVLALWSRIPRRGRRIASVAAVYAVGICVYYGLFFGAPWFLSRFLFPLSPLLAAAGVAIAAAALSRLNERRMRTAVVGALAVVTAVVAYQNRQMYALGTEHNHFQVVEWVDANVGDDQWVGAIQTDTLGFFHDKTINLDGKVNPDALHARLAGRHQEYIVGSPIDYFADWAGFSWWRDIDVFDAEFELIVDDPAHDLAVFRRREPDS
jgi:hypothetical protein